VARKPPPPDNSQAPEDFPQTTPRELHATSDIRFVMRETATLTERIEGLTRAIDKLGPAFEKALEKHAADVKERLADLKSESKDSSGKIQDIEKKVSFVKGVMWALGGLFAIAIVILGVIVRKLLG
jgi:chromosome segregation ATPase